MKVDFRERIAGVISRHIGREQAISIEQIKAVTGISDRVIKKHVHDLRMAGNRIGSSRSAGEGANPGYYMLSSAEELTHFLAEYLGQARTEMRLVKSMLGTDFPPLAALERQLAFDLADEHA